MCFFKWSNRKWERATSGRQEGKCRIITTVIWETCTKVIIISCHYLHPNTLYYVTPETEDPGVWNTDPTGKSLPMDHYLRANTNVKKNMENTSSWQILPAITDKRSSVIEDVWKDRQPEMFCSTQKKNHTHNAPYSVCWAEQWHCRVTMYNDTFHCFYWIHLIHIGHWTLA